VKPSFLQTMDVVSTCLRRDLPVYRHACESLREHIAGARIHVITRAVDFPAFRNACGEEVRLVDEREILADMSLDALRQMPLPFFPEGAGWYFQQFLKLGFHRLSESGGHFLIWDADTILLRPLEFVDDQGRSLFVMADEHHGPYFQTFENLFGYPAARDYSFISQHQVVEKSVLREMFREIEARDPEGKSWMWVVMERLKGAGSNLFSEYETYGHYLKHRYPGRVVGRKLPWTRHGERIAGYPPKPARFPRLADEFAFAAFESEASPLRRLRRSAGGMLRSTTRALKSMGRRSS
jgi:hypothetical protein